MDIRGAKAPTCFEVLGALLGKSLLADIRRYKKVNNRLSKVFHLAYRIGFLPEGIYRKIVDLAIFAKFSYIYMGGS